jgi:hypothetical protein
LLGLTAGLAAPILAGGVGAVLGSMGVTSTVAVAGTTGLITTGTVLGGGGKFKAIISFIATVKLICTSFSCWWEDYGESHSQYLRVQVHACGD